MTSRRRNAAIYLGLRPADPDTPSAEQVPWRVMIPMSLVAGTIFGLLSYWVQGLHAGGATVAGVFFGMFWGLAFRWAHPRYVKRRERSDSPR